MVGFATVSLLISHLNNHLINNLLFEYLVQVVYQKLFKEYLQDCLRINSFDLIIFFHQLPIYFINCLNFYLQDLDKDSSNFQLTIIAKQQVSQEQFYFVYLSIKAKPIYLKNQLQLLMLRLYHLKLHHNFNSFNHQLSPLNVISK